MLDSLTIDNIAVIEHAELNIGAGFCALTGEAGAGKSILIDSLLAVQGFRTSKDLVRSGCDHGSVTALFSSLPEVVKSVLIDMDLYSDDGTLCLSRTIYSDGRSKCRVNGKTVNTSVLKQITSPLVNIHGQQDNHSLLDPANHYVYVDRMGDHKRQIETYRKAFDAYVKIKKENDAFNIDENEKQTKIESLNYKINEIISANITVGEMERLIAEKTFLSNFESIINAVSTAHSLLVGEDTGAADALSGAADRLETIAQFDEKYKRLSEKLSELGYEADEVTRELGGILEDFSFDPTRLEDVEERLDTLRRLTKKYGGSEEEILLSLERFKAELDGFESMDERKAQLKKELNTAAKELTSAAKDLTEKRIAVGKKLSKAICKELAFMDMPNVVFEVSVERSPFTKNGADKIEFLISTNPGEPLKPLSKIASGGELSRIMLSILSVITDKDEIDTLIFDEIDSGISGRAAGKVASQLKKISSGKQVICITHLAQIAAAADNQYLIEKSIKNDRAFTSVTPLDRQRRIQEIARINSGSHITENTLKSAEEMLSAYNN